MDPLASSDRKRKAAEEPEVASNSDDQTQKKRKAPRVSLDSSTALSQIASLPGNAPPATERVAIANNPSASDEPEHEGSMRWVEKKLQDLSGSDNAKVYAALDALLMELDKEDPATCDNIVAAGGCRALVQLLKHCLEKAIDGIPRCAQVTVLHELAELATLHSTLRVIIRLTYQHDESRVGIATIGGVEAGVKVMKTFPKCQALQDRACGALQNLAFCSFGEKKAIDSGGLEVLLATINNHLGSSAICKYACFALYNIICDNKENAELLISLGGGAAVAKVGTKWRDIDEVHEVVQDLTAEIKAAEPTLRSSCKSSEVTIASPKFPAFDSQPTTPTVSTGSSKVPAFDSRSTSPEDTTASPTNPTISPQSTLGIYHESSDDFCCSPNVPGVPSKPRNDSQLKPEASPELVSRPPRNDRKCKSKGAPVAVVGRNGDRKCKNTVTVTILESTGEGECNATTFVTRSSPRTDASTSTVAFPKMNAQVATERVSTADAVSAFDIEHEESTSNAEPKDQIQSIGTLVQDIFYSDNITFYAALHSVRMNLVENSTKWDHVVAVGGCFAVVPIMRLVVNEMIRWLSKEAV
jgi:hypothetical protein